ncbi:MAG: hypothetical protein QG621_503 [Patescibacteria group bacterium]|nr:hypothetical protein [Patescibacteria group bacterium]
MTVRPIGSMVKLAVLATRCLAVPRNDVSAAEAVIEDEPPYHRNSAKSWLVPSPQPKGDATRWAIEPTAQPTTIPISWFTHATGSLSPRGRLRKMMKNITILRTIFIMCTPSTSVSLLVMRRARRDSPHLEPPRRVMILSRRATGIEPVAQVVGTVVVCSK